MNRQRNRRRLERAAPDLLADAARRERIDHVMDRFLDTADDAARDGLRQRIDEACILRGLILPPPPQEEPEPPPPKFLESVEETAPPPDVVEEPEPPPPTPQQAWIDEGCRWRPRGEPDPYYWEDDDDTEDYDPLRV